MRKIILSITLFLSLLLVVTSEATFAQKHPSLSGKLVFHRYSNYDALDSKLYLYDFSEDRLQCLSDSFSGVTHAMNGMFSPDGTQITFMGISNKDQWDIFLYNLNTKQLRNLTNKDAGRHEDPKFSPDGKAICYKSCPDGKTYAQLYRINLASGRITRLTQDNTEHSMPYYSQNGETLYYAAGTGKTSQIWRLKEGKRTCLYRRTGVDCYYPIASRYTDTLYFSRWYSKGNHADQIYAYYPKTKKAKRLSFNRSTYDTSDFCEVSKSYAIVSSTKDSDTYDLYLVRKNGKNLYNLNNYHNGLNSSLQELGADYWKKE